MIISLLIGLAIGSIPLYIVYKAFREVDFDIKIPKRDLENPKLVLDVAERANWPYICGECGIGMSITEYVCPQCMSREKLKKNS